MQQQQKPASTVDPETISDIELARRAVTGDQMAFEAIMRRHNQLLFRTARGILKTDEEAEDALQEAYLRAWRALDSFRADAKLSTWLVRIVVNEALGRIRRKHVPVIPLDGTVNTFAPKDRLADNRDQQPDHTAMRMQLLKLLEARIDLLPATYRMVFMLRAVQELSVRETAEALDIPEATVRTRFFRARSLMRESLASEIDIATADAFSFDGARCDRIVANVLERLSR